MRPGIRKRVIVVIITLFIVALSKGQSVQDPATDKQLYIQVLSLDSAVFSAFNNRDIETFKSFFSEGLEFYHDEGGLTGYQHTVDFIKSTAANNNQLKRELVKEKFEVYPIPGYGAMQIGEHRFCHVENGKQDCGTFKFVHIWQQKDGKWKITRIVSYGHRPPVSINERKAISLSTSVLSKYNGKYKGTKTGEVLVTNSADFLTLLIKDKKFVIYPETETLFFSKESDLTFEFLKSGTAEAKIIVRERGQIAEELTLAK